MLVLFISIPSSSPFCPSSCPESIKLIQIFTTLGTIFSPGFVIASVTNRLPSMMTSTTTVVVVAREQLVEAISELVGVVIEESEWVSEGRGRRTTTTMRVVKWYVDQIEHDNLTVITYSSGSSPVGQGKQRTTVTALTRTHTHD